jgi:Na+/proline symporter
VLLYIAVATVLGWRAHRRTDDAVAFWTAGRDLSASSVGLSISAGFLSISWACVYATQLYYWYGLGAAWLITIPWLLELGGIYMLARRYHALPAFSQPEMVGDRFGPRARRMVALAIAFVFLAWGGAEVYVAATLLAPELGLTIQTTILGISLVVGVYSSVGGFRAVVATDQLQYGLVALFMVAVALLAAYGLAEQGSTWPPEGMEAARSGLPWTHGWGPGTALIVLTFVTYVPAGLFETDLWVRVQAARNERAARRGMVLAALTAFFFIGLLPCFIGVAALELFPLEDGAIPAVLGTDGNAIIPALVDRYAPAWLVVLVAVGLVAAAMSTIDTCANVMALSLAYDLLQLHHRPDGGARASQWVMAAVMGATCLFALNTASLWDVFYLSGGILTTAVAFPVAAVFIPGVSGRGVAWSSGCGFGGIIIAYLLQKQGFMEHIQPEWLNASGLSYVLWGLLAAALGYAAGRAGTAPDHP